MDKTRFPRPTLGELQKMERQTRIQFGMRSLQYRVILWAIEDHPDQGIKTTEGVKRGRPKRDPLVTKPVDV